MVVSTIAGLLFGKNFNHRAGITKHMSTSPSQLRHLLSKPGIIRSLGAHDVFTALLVQQAGLETVFLGGFKFMLTSSDDYTEKYMQDNGDIFPEASFKAIIAKIKAPAKNYPDLQTYAIEILKKFDKNNNKFIDVDEFTEGLRAMNINITNHE